MFIELFPAIFLLYLCKTKQTSRIMGKTETVTFRVTPELKKVLSDIADDTDTTVSEVISEFLASATSSPVNAAIYNVLRTNPDVMGLFVLQEANMTAFDYARVKMDGATVEAWAKFMESLNRLLARELADIARRADAKVREARAAKN